MSKKYVPSFLKNLPPQADGASPWPSAVIDTNKVDNGFPMGKKEKPIINTSRPAMEAPKLVPATLAALTSNGGGGQAVSTGSGSKSFASKFAEQAKIAEDPNYVPPPKPLNFNSEDDFPALGSPKKAESPKPVWGGKKPNDAHNFTVSSTPSNAVVIQSEDYVSGNSVSTGNKWAEMAKSWAKHKEDEEERERKKKQLEEQMLREAELMKSIPIIGLHRRNRRFDDDDDDDSYQELNNNEENYISEESDSFGMPEEDENQNILQDVEEEQDEFNSNIGWDGRRRDDLY
jgi:hypothetical protein